MSRAALIICVKKLGDQDPLLGSAARNVMNIGSSVFEPIVIDGAKTIAHGYNRGAKDAPKGCDLLVFAHCDTEFLFPFWTWWECCALLKHESVGFVGVCGSRKLEYDGQQWPPSGFGSGGVMHRQGDLRWYSSFGVFGQTLALDGLFLACRREVFEKLGGFDEDYPGWHYYDVDITLRAYLAGYTNHTFPLLISHGVENFQATQIEEWKKDRAVFLRKFGARMPMVLESKQEVAR